MNVLVLVGSLRAGATNRLLADAAVAHLPAGVDGTVFARLAELPHYSEDLDHDDEPPQVARDLREAVADADAVRMSHVMEFFGLLGGGLHEASWDGSGKPNSRLAILPGTTHFDILSQPALVAAVIPFLDAPMP